jgi:hypothetical protein
MSEEPMRRDDTTDARTEITDASDATTSGTPETTTAVHDSVIRIPDADEHSAAERRTEDDRIELLDGDRPESFRGRWVEIQAAFVDHPRESVEQADALVAEVVQELQASFDAARERLESQWSRGDEASTEDLRLALRRYRSFFDRLLTT